MRTLDDAWRWYEVTKRQLKLMQRLGSRYWEQLPWEGPLGKDDHFRLLEGWDLVKDADYSLTHLDDLAVMVLFSVFEATVRELVLSEVREEVATIRHAALRSAAQETIQRIEEGSFYRVVEPFKSLDTSLTEEVNQVRQYRNWVAHGRRGSVPCAVDPETAFNRLDRFLALLNQNPPSAAHTWVISGHGPRAADLSYSTVTLLARFRGLSMSQPRSRATW